MLQDLKKKYIKNVKSCNKTDVLFFGRQYVTEKLQSDK